MFAVNPRQVARYRERHAMSGANSDAGHAHALADMVRTDGHQLHPRCDDSALVEGIQLVARAHQTSNPESPFAAAAGHGPAAAMIWRVLSARVTPAAQAAAVELAPVHRRTARPRSWHLGITHWALADHMVPPAGFEPAT
ncbi:MAG TPA: hypothetical protein VM287_15655 [Egibacteraceae bacterium]|nr:hypothetical protein [Egibacteraceae bacterium]